MPVPPRRRLCTPDEVEAALVALDRSATPIAASSWPASLDRLDQPGLYSWWVDADGARDLGTGLGTDLHAGRIYAGQTGATKWPSGKAGRMTLRERIGGNHLRGTIYGSTFRKTLASALRQPLSPEPAGATRLARESEQALSAWIRKHLQVAVYPFPERDALIDLERQVLARLDPPLNLDGMQPTPLRSLLTARRAEMAAATTDAPSPEAVVTTHSVRTTGDERVPLHEEIREILRAAGAGWLTAQQIADEVNRRGRYLKRDGSAVSAFQIHGRTRNYDRIFIRDGAKVRLAEVETSTRRA